MVNGAPAGSEEASDQDVDDMTVFVDRLAAAGSDRPTKLAAIRIRRAIDTGNVPPGLRKLAEGLVASAAEPPAQRRPADEPSTVVAAMEVRNLVVLADHTPADVAGAVAALLADGRRVVVTGETDGALAAVRDALPGDVARRVVPRLPDMTPTELRELRRLLLTDTAGRRARPGQQLPADAAVPSVEAVARLCRELERDGGHRRETVGVLDELLADLPPERLTAIAAVARCVRGKLGALGPRHHRSWTWDLLADLVVQRNRGTFDRLREEVAQAADTAAWIDGRPSVAFAEPLTEEGIEALFAYLEYLQDGGRPRQFFRAPEQRDVQPVLSQIRVAGQVPESIADIELVLRHRELVERMIRIEGCCAELGIPLPGDSTDLSGLREELDKVAAAARSMAALRADVLFLRADSPLTPPGVATADDFAGAILAFIEQAPVKQAEQALDRMADELATAVPAAAAAPEHEQAVAALRARDLRAYADAREALGAVRRETADEERKAALLATLGRSAPALVDAWTESGNLGIAAVQPLAPLLSDLPAADSADVVVVLGAAELGMERLLVTAVAPRVVVVAAPEESAADPSVLSVLRRAGALVIRAGTGRVVPLPRAVPTPREAHAG